MAHREQIPDRWQRYTRYGTQVRGTRFIPFKVPLDETYGVSEELEFTPTSLIQRLKNRKLELGLVIDLTNTDRYYDPKIFRDQGIKHEKICIPGQEVPTLELKKKFLSKVDNFIENHPEEDLLIGVHCTHGVNRTGHLVCRYMIDRMEMDPDEAIKRFKEARHDIEELYTRDLRTSPRGMAQYENCRN